MSASLITIKNEQKNEKKESCRNCKLLNCGRFTASKHNSKAKLMRDDQGCKDYQCTALFKSLFLKHIFGFCILNKTDKEGKKKVILSIPVNLKSLEMTETLEVLF